MPVIPSDLAAPDRLRALAFAATTSGVVITDPTSRDGPIVDVNPAFERITGYARDEVLGRNCRFLQGPGTDPITLARLRDAIVGGRDVTETLLNYRKDGTAFWNELRITPVFDDMGRLAQFVGVQTDVTQRVRAEEALRESEAKYRALVERLPVVAYTRGADCASSLTYIAPQIEALLGYPRATLLGDPDLWSRILHSDDRERAVAMQRHSIESGEPFALEYRLLTADGRWVWVWDETVLVENQRGEPAYRQGLLQDVTDRKQAEEAGRADAARMTELVAIQAEIAAAPPDPGAVMRLVAERAMKLTGAAGAGVAVPAGDEVVYPVVVGAARAVEGVGYPTEGSLTGLCLRSGELQRTDDAGADPRVNRDQIGAAGVRSMIVAPLRHGGRVVGALAISSPEPGAFGGREERLVAVLAGMVGTALANAEAFAALRASEARFRALVENAPDAVAVFDPDLTVRLVTPAFRRILGWTPADFGDDPRFDLIHPEDAPGVLAAFAEVERAAGARAAREYRVRHADGSWRWLDAVAQNRLDDPAVAGIVVNFRDVTERKQTETALEAERDLLRALMDALPEAVWVKDASSRFLRLNPPAARTLGLDDPAAAAGKTDADFFPEAVARRYLEDERRVMASGEPILDAPDVRGEGEHATWWLTSRVPLRDGSGHAVGVVGSSRDVTRQRRAEAAMRRAERRYRDLFAQAPVMYVATRITDLGPLVADCNAMFWRTLGYARRAEVVGRPMADFLAPESRREVFEEGGYEAALRGTLRAVERQLLTRDGRTIDVLVQAGPDLDEDGVVRGTRAAFLDVTERKRLEGELRAAEERYRTLVERLPAVVYLLANDAVQTPLYFSPRITELLGLSPEQAMARSGSWLARVHPDDRERIAAESARTDASGEPFWEEYRHLRGDGGYAWVRDECEAVRDADGRITAWHGVLYDVSAERRLREELVAAKEAAEEANRLKGTFLSTMSHELRTPMNAIVGYAHLLLDGMAGDLNPAQADDVGQIAAGADRLLGLINNVLDLSRIEAGGLDLNLEPVDLATLAEGVRTELAPLAGAKGIAIVVDVKPGLRVGADAARLRQVLLNLAGNAVKFTEVGTVGISAQAMGESVEIAVADTGIGIAPEALPHVFDEFRQADGSTTRKYGGSGLGLTIAKRLVDLHGGTIRAESEPGLGSRFTVALPIPARPGANAGMDREP